MPRVFRGELLEPALLAALGRANLDSRAASLGQELGQGRGISGVPRDDDLRGDARRRPVVLEAEGLEHGGDVLTRNVLEVEGVAVDQPPVTQREDLEHRAIAFGGEPDHIDRADRASIRGLALGEVLDAPEPVAVAGRLLEALRGGGVLHLLFELALDRIRLARQELDYQIDDRAVVLLRDVADARRQAPFDVVVEAGNSGVAAGFRAPLGPVRE